MSGFEQFFKDYDSRYGDGKDFSVQQVSVVQEETIEDVEPIIELQLDEEVQEKGFLETFQEIFEKYDSLNITEEETKLFEAAGIDDELIAIQEAMESIRSKMNLNESVAVSLLPAIATGFAALLGWYTKRHAESKSAIPRPVVNTLHNINRFIGDKDTEERRAIIRNSVLKSNPNADKKTVDALVSLAQKNADKLADSKVVSKDSRKSGNYETDFAAINKKRFNLA
jgi:hypothetical protein